MNTQIVPVRHFQLRPLRLNYRFVFNLASFPFNQQCGRTGEKGGGSSSIGRLGELFKSCQDLTVETDGDGGGGKRYPLTNWHWTPSPYGNRPYCNADLRETDKEWAAFTSRFIVCGVYENRAGHLYIIPKTYSELQDKLVLVSPLPRITPQQFHSL